MQLQPTLIGDLGILQLWSYKLGRWSYSLCYQWVLWVSWPCSWVTHPGHSTLPSKFIAIYRQTYLKGQCHDFFVSLWKAKRCLDLSGSPNKMFQDVTALKLFAFVSCSTDGKDWNVLKLERTFGNFFFFEVLKLSEKNRPNIQIVIFFSSLLQFLWHVPLSLTGAFCLSVKVISNDFSTLWQKTNKQTNKQKPPCSDTAQWKVA